MAAKTIYINGKPLKIQFGMNALRKLEKESGHSINMIGLLLVSGRGGFGLLQEILWSGLEGARMKLNPAAPEFTVEQVGDLIDEYDGGVSAMWNENSPVLKEVMDAWLEAFPEKTRKDLPTDPPPAVDVPLPIPPTGTT